MPATVDIRRNLEQVQERMAAALRRAGRSDAVTLVAVTKTVEADRILQAYLAGIRHFGENRVQEFDEKRLGLSLPEAQWHMIGHLQSNKARAAVDLFDRLDSIDSARLAERVARAAREAGKQVPVLLQVRLGDEPTKHGTKVEALPELIERIASLERIKLEGLMTMPPFLRDPELMRPYFRQLRQLAESLDQRRIPGASFGELSMGMTNDFEVAIEEGATQVRLGTALFGARPPLGDYEK